MTNVFAGWIRIQAKRDRRQVSRNYIYSSQNFLPQKYLTILSEALGNWFQLFLFQLQRRQAPETNLKVCGQSNLLSQNKCSFFCVLTMHCNGINNKHWSPSLFKNNPTSIMKVFWLDYSGTSVVYLISCLWNISWTLQKRGQSIWPT